MWPLLWWLSSAVVFEISQKQMQMKEQNDVFDKILFMHMKSWILDNFHVSLNNIKLFKYVKNYS